MASCKPRGWDGHGILPRLSSVQFFFYLFIPFISFLSVPVVGDELEWFWLVDLGPLQLFPDDLSHFQLLCGELSLLLAHRFAFPDG
jgi:hypothetical protein